MGIVITVLALVLMAEVAYIVWQHGGDGRLW